MFADLFSVVAGNGLRHALGDAEVGSIHLHTLLDHRLGRIPRLFDYVKPLIGHFVAGHPHGPGLGLAHGHLLRLEFQVDDVFLLVLVDYLVEADGVLLLGDGSQRLEGQLHRVVQLAHIAQSLVAYRHHESVIVHQPRVVLLLDHAEAYFLALECLGVDLLLDHRVDALGFLRLVLFVNRHPYNDLLIHSWQVFIRPPGSEGVRIEFLESVEDIPEMGTVVAHVPVDSTVFS